MPRRTHAANFLVKPHEGGPRPFTPANKNQLSDDQADMLPMSCFNIMLPNENQLSDDQADMLPMSCFNIMSPNENQLSDDQAGMSPMSCFSIMSPNDIQIYTGDTLRIKQELDTCINITKGTSEVTSARMALETHLKIARSLTEKLETKIISCKSSEATCLRARARGR
jgi:hypothetical protein